VSVERGSASFVVPRARDESLGRLRAPTPISRERRITAPMSELSGWLWIVIDVVAVAALGIALAYGSIFWSRKRMSAETRKRQAGTVRENYRHGG
jgi:hypothetical protein